jgi:hypothetical protein
MKLPRYVISVLVATVSSVVLTWFSWRGYGFSWPSLALVAVAGMVIAAFVHEFSVVRYLVPLALGSVALAVLTTLLMALRPGITISTGLFIPIALLSTLTFFGGLFAVIGKGVYSLSAGWAERLLLFGGPAVLTATSLAIFVPKYGGSVYSHLHGWPYAWLTYTVADIDGTPMAKWYARSGTWFASPVRDYLFYFLIFVTVFYFLRLAGQRLGGRWRDARLKAFVMAVMLVGGIIAQLSYNSLWQQQLWQNIIEAGACTEDAECVVAGSHGAFTCAVVTNRTEARRVMRLLNRYPGAYPKLECLPEVTPWCNQGRCEVRVKP